MPQVLTWGNRVDRFNNHRRAEKPRDRAGLLPPGDGSRPAERIVEEPIAPDRAARGPDEGRDLAEWIDAEMPVFLRTSNVPSTALRRAPEEYQ